MHDACLAELEEESKRSHKRAVPPHVEAGVPVMNAIEQVNRTCRYTVRVDPDVPVENGSLSTPWLRHWRGHVDVAILKPFPGLLLLVLFLRPKALEELSTPEPDGLDPVEESLGPEF